MQSKPSAPLFVLLKPNPAKIIFTCIAVVILLAGMASHAAVSVVGTPQTATITTSGTSSTTISGFNMGAGNCLVVMVSGKENTTAVLPTVTFGGSALDGTTGNNFINQGANCAVIFWAINPTKRSGDVVVTYGANTLSGGGVTVMSLSGLGSGGGAGETASGVNTTCTTINLTYTATANGMVILSGSDSRSGTPTIAGANFTTYTGVRGNYNACGNAHGYGAVTTVGSSTSTYTPISTTTGGRNSAVAVAFNPGYVVTYDGNGNTGGTAPNNAGYVSGATVTVANNTGALTKSGYVFAGWNTQADGNGTTYAAGSGTFTINADTTLYAKWTAASATITTSGTLSAFNTTYGTASAAQTFTVSGNNISVGILVTAPTGFEVSQSSGSGYGSSTTVSGSGTISATTIYVRLAAATVAGSYSGNVACTSTGATEQDVAIPSSSVGNATLTITSPTASNKVFDGTSTATVGGTLSASQNGDSLTLAGNFPSSAPGTALTVTFGVTGTHFSSYTLMQPSPVVTANIAGTSIILNAADAAESSSFNSAGNWSIAAAPVAGNTYSAAFVLRTPTSGSFAFAGDSLTIQTNGQLAVKSANGTTQTANNLILNGGSIAESTGGGATPILAGNITASANAAISAGSGDALNVTAPISGTSSVTLTIGGATTGTVRFSGANTFSGTVTVNGSTSYSATAGVLQLNNLNAVQNATLNLATTLSGVAGLTFNSAANTGTFNVGALAGANAATTFALKDTATTPAAVTISVGANNATTTYAGIITDIGSLTKVGNGTLTLSGANTYSGGTTVSAGALLVDNTTGSGTGSGNVTVNGGTLGGSGTISGAVTVNSGGTLAPGASVGTLTLGSSLTLNAGSVTDIELGTGPTGDKASASGAVNYGGTLKLTRTGTLSAGTVDLFDGSSLNGVFSTVQLVNWDSAFRVSTNSLTTDGSIAIAANASPVAKHLTNGVSQGDSITQVVIGGKNGPTDGDGDSLTVTNVTQPSSGLVTSTSSSVTFNAASASPGTYTYNYTVTDPFGATDTKTVTTIVSAGGSGANIRSLTGTVPNVTVHALGIPGAVYSLQYTDSLTPVNWQDISGTDTADVPPSETPGAITLTDSNAPMSGRYYRTKHVSGP